MVAAIFKDDIDLWPNGRFNVRFINGLATSLTLMLSIYATAEQPNLTSCQSKSAEIDIDHELLKATNRDSGVSFGVQFTHVKNNCSTAPLHLGPKLGQETEELSMMLQSAPNQPHSRIFVPPNVEHRILEFIKNPPPGRCDCNCFSHYVNNVAFNFGEFINREWLLEEIQNEAMLHAGDTVAMGTSKESLTHFAIYLGEGLYISKFGSSGPLIVTNIPEMKRAFAASRVWHLSKAGVLPEWTYQDTFLPSAHTTQ